VHTATFFRLGKDIQSAKGLVMYWVVSNDRNPKQGFSKDRIRVTASPHAAENSRVWHHLSRISTEVPPFSPNELCWRELSKIN